MTENLEFSTTVMDIIDRKISVYKPYRDNYSVDIDIVSEDEDNLVRHFFYKVYRTTSYKSVITRSKMTFIEYFDGTEIDRKWDNAENEFRIKIFDRFEFTNSDDTQFGVLNLEIDGFEFEKPKVRKYDGFRVYEFSVPSRFRDGEAHDVRYTTFERIIKRAHSLVEIIRIPCKGLVCTVDYSRSDIAYLNYFDFFTSRTDAIVNTAPDPAARKVSISIRDQWIIPKSGLVFTWSRGVEKNQDYELAKSKFPSLESFLEENR